MLSLSLLSAPVLQYVTAVMAFIFMFLSSIIMEREFKLMASMNFMAKMDRTFYYFIQWCENRHAIENMNEAYILQHVFFFYAEQTVHGLSDMRAKKHKF